MIREIPRCSPKLNGKSQTRLLGESRPRLLGRVSPSSRNDVWDEFSLMAENGEYYLTSSDWESLTNTSDVYLKATKLFQQLSAVAIKVMLRAN